MTRRHPILPIDSGPPVRLSESIGAAVAFAITIVALVLGGLP